MNSPLATELRLRTTSRVLQVTFADGQVFELPFEYLRVHSPSAEVKGHGPGQEVLVTGKSAVGKGRAVKPGPGIQDPRSIFRPGLKPGKRGESCIREWADCNTSAANCAQDLTNQRLTLHLHGNDKTTP